jgi:SAM-dependent methyltransferase
MTDLGRGYVTDIPYTRGFHRELAPAWLDFVATISGIAPPVQDEGFSWCDLGCGQGVTTVILAATHPRGRFVGIDLMPEHIAHARRFAAEAGIANVEFRAADFADETLKFPAFDYIVSHGVYSWVDAATQAALRQFIDRQLAVSGLVYLGYNAMPGWAAELPFQRLLVALGRDLPGDSAARFRSAAEIVRRVADGAPSLTASRIATHLDDLMAQHPLAYLAHEYMGSHWQPLFVTEMREAMASIGLSPAGSASLADNFDSFVLRRREREAIAGIDDPDGHEIARDFLMHKQFRRDVFSRDGDELGDDERRDRVVAACYALARPPGEIEYEVDTEAGKLLFDNATARAIVAGLVSGPRTGAGIVAEGIEPQDLVGSLMALTSAGMVRPVSPNAVPVTALNDAIFRRIDGPEPIHAMALSCGTAVRLDAAMLRALRGGGVAGAVAGGAVENWSRFLAIHTCGG